MNLVMQFRKVCNHPDLFERRDIKSPFQFQAPIWPPHGYSHRVVKELCAFPDISSVNRNAIEFHLPVLLWEDLLHGFRMASLHHVLSIFSIWHASYLCTRSKLSHLNLLGISFSNISRLATSSIFDQLLVLSELRKHEESRQYLSKLPSQRQLLKISLKPNLLYYSSRLLQNPFHELLFVQPNSLFALKFHYLGNFVPAAAAAPVNLYCSNRSFEYRYHEMLYPPKHGSTELLYFSEQNVQSLSSPFYGIFEHGLIPASCPIRGWSFISLSNAEKLIFDAEKMKILDSLLPKLKSEGHRVLIYSQMTKMIDILEDYMIMRKYKFMRLDGSSKISERRDMVSDFQNRTDIFAFLLSTRAGGLGINLTAADTVIFYDSDWNPTVDQQAMDRAHRLGQTRQVVVYRLITKHSIEERILQRARQKSEIHKMVITGEGYQADRGDTLKAGEVVTLLLDDDELETQLRRKKEEKEKEEMMAKRKREESEKKMENRAQVMQDRAKRAQERAEARALRKMEKEKRKLEKEMKKEAAAAAKSKSKNRLKTSKASKMTEGEEENPPELPTL
eukprot:Sdes_comp15753_c0_seq1m4801